MRQPNKFGRPPLRPADVMGARLIGGEPQEKPVHQVGYQHYNTPMAQQACMAVNGPHHSLLYIFGGLTKLEQAAIHLAAGDPNVSLESAVVRAEELLNLCALRQASISQEMEPPAEAEQASPIATP